VARGFTAMKFCPVDATEIVDGLDVLKTVEARVRQLTADAALRRKIGSHNESYAKEFYITRCAEKYLDAFSRSRPKGP